MRSMAIGTPDRGDVAFAVQLQPAAQASTTEPVTSQPAPPQTGVSAVRSPANAAASAEQSAAIPSTSVETPDGAEEAPASSGTAGQAATVDRERKPAVEHSPRPADPLDSHSDLATAIPTAKTAEQGTPPGALRQEAVPEQIAARDAAPERSNETVNVEPKPPLQPASAHDIKLEVSGGERRVEVRLSERGGEVRVAVRTPDSHLAGTLRENLPELATRLAETGLRSEIWRPAGSSAGDWRHSAEAGPGNLAQEADTQSRGNGGGAQDDGRQRHPHSSQEQKSQKEKGKDFAWLMSSLR
jgi:hypothetical protein